MSIVLPLIEIGARLLDKVIPDPAAKAAAQLELIRLQQAGELAAMDADVRLALGQLEVNKAEAESPDLFRGGWRPMAGYVCVFGLAYTFVLQPLLPWLITVFGGASAPLPALDTEILMTLLLGMLGLGGLRTQERLRGVIPKGK